MPLFSRLLQRLVLCLLGMISGVCAAQQGAQFLNLPRVQPTGGRVTSFEAGVFQNPSGGTDIVYVNAPVSSVGMSSSSVTAGIMLDGAGFTALPQNQITFPNTANVVEAVGDYNGDGITDFAFAFVPQGSKSIDVCVYYGTGATAAQVAAGRSSFSGPATASRCLVIPSNDTAPPVLSNMAAFVMNPSGTKVAQLLLEDSANGVLHIIANNGTTGSIGNAQGYVEQVAVLSDGAGPIYVGDFNGDGFTDFIINGQTGLSASAFLSNVGGSFFVPTHIYTFGNGVRSMLMQDMDGDGIADMVIENNSGGIEIHKGTGDGTFAAAPEGGTSVSATAGSVAGDGGRLVAINPRTLDLLTATPVGLSLLQRQSGSLNYGLTAIYNIGSGRSSFALDDFFGAGNLDLAVDSAEGVAIVAGNADGTFRAANAYAALASALGAVVGRFRNAANNPNGNVDVVVETGATQAQLLTGNGDGTFATFAAQVDTGSGPSNVPATVWSNILSGDFDGDGNLDVLYSFTGVPSPPPSGSNFPMLYIQYGKGDGTFASPGFAWTLGTVPGVNSSTLYSESAIGDFNGDGISDIASGDPEIEGTLLGIRGAQGLTAGLVYADLGVPDFEQVAAGFFKVNRTSQQDIVFEVGPSFVPYVNKQDGTGKNFTPMAAVSSPGAPLQASALLLTDVDGDGKGDLVVVYYNAAASSSGVPTSQVYIWWGNGDGSFVTVPLVLSLSRDYYLSAVADMNGDGLPDLALSDGDLVSILYNQGGRSFGAALANGLLSSEQHYLAGQGINSISIADVNGDGRPDLVVANGGATLSNAVALGGRTASSLTLAANPADINTGGITVLLNGITTKPVTGALAASPEPSGYRAAFTLTATITPTAGVAIPTGPVQFYVDGVAVGSAVTLVPGATSSSATYVVAANNGYASGAHALTAMYSGDTADAPITLSGTHSIASIATTTTTTLELCVGPSVACPSNGYVAPPYVAMLTMIYGQTYNGITGVTASDGSALSGSVLFYDDYNGVQTLLCTLSASGGTCPPSVGSGAQVGTHVFTSVYTGDATHSPSTSFSVTIVVTQDTTSATLTGAPNPSPAGQPVTLTATLVGNDAPLASAGPAYSYAPPAGTVVFTYGSTVLGAGTLVATASGISSTATLTTSVLPVGIDVITASYASTLDFGAAGASFTETITPSIAGSFTLTVTPTPVSVGVGYSALLTVTVTPQNGFSQSVNLSCANLPIEASCFFDSATVANGSGTTSLVVGTTAPHSCGTTQPYFLGFNGGGGVAPFTLPAIAGLLAMFLPGRRRWLRGVIGLVVVAGAMQMTGCGNCTDLGTRPATYTFQVMGTSAVTGEVVSQSVTITVTI
jgi:hypothetical protein